MTTVTEDKERQNTPDSGDEDRSRSAEERRAILSALISVKRRLEVAG